MASRTGRETPNSAALPRKPHHETLTLALLRFPRRVRACTGYLVRRGLSIKQARRAIILPLFEQTILNRTRL